jgi:hypothetical protein
VPWPYEYTVGYGVPVLIVVAGWLVRRHLASRTVAPLPLLRPQVEPALVPALAAPALAAPALAAPAPAAYGSTAPWPAAPMPASLVPAGPAAALAAEEHAISAPPLRSILVDDPLPRRIRV